MGTYSAQNLRAVYYWAKINSYDTIWQPKKMKEVAEYQVDKSVEEMADVLEVLFAICEARGYSVEELMQVREMKREKRGGFADRIFWIGNEE